MFFSDLFHCEFNIFSFFGLFAGQNMKSKPIKLVSHVIFYSGVMIN